MQGLSLDNTSRYQQKFKTNEINKQKDLKDFVDYDAHHIGTLYLHSNISKYKKVIRERIFIAGCKYVKKSKV